MLNRRKSLSKNIISLILAVLMVFSCLTWSFAGTKYFKEDGTTYQMESLDRGLIAAVTPGGVFLSWRLFKEEVTGYSATGLTGANFNVYRNGNKIATVTDSTNYLDASGTASDSYYVRAVVNGTEVDKSATVTPLPDSFIQVPLKKPANYTATIDNEDGTTPTALNFAYTAGDFSVGDVDGDGQYEYFVKWEGNPQDVIGKGYTGKTLIDCYKLDGTLLYRIDLGVNIREGAHYTQFMVADFDGNGKAEIIMKTAPGTSTVRVNSDGTVDESSRKYITMLPEDIAAGYKNTDDYRNTYRDYYEHIVDLFKNWQNHPEVKNGHWPATLQECFGITTTSSGIIGGNFDAQGNVVTTTYSAIGSDLLALTYPLSDTNARILADYFINTYAPARSSKNELKKFIGYIFTGPEYLTIFNGETGAELETIRYKPGRDDDGLMWGDYAMSRIEPCNRVERMQAEVAYLDGKKPYAVFGRGYYTRTTLVAYSWNGQHLQEYWYVDSGYPVMTNPFNDSPHGRDGTIPGYEKITTQGAHTMVDADVDGDGCDELILGSATIDHDGTVLYSSFDTISQGPNAGTYARLGHGDSIHVTDIIPSRPGLEIFMCHEGASGAPYGVSMRDAKTGQVIWGTYKDRDNGRCMIGDIDPTLPGIENWSIALRQGDEAGTQISTSMPGTNANIKWAADMTTQIVNGSIDQDVTIQKWNPSTKKSDTILTAAGYRTNNYTKGNPCLVADVLGDYREELIVRSAASDNFRIYFNSSEVSNHKLFTLMDDRQYRTGVARQNDGYNQPAYTSFYYASDINWEELYKSLVTPATGLLIDRSSLRLEKGTTEYLNAAVLPVDAYQGVIWTSDNSSVATVSTSGAVTAVATGSAVITAASSDGGFTKTCTVTVIDLTDLNAKISLAQTLYKALPESSVKTNLKTAMDAAVAIQGNTEAEQAGIDSAAAALQSVIDVALGELPADKRVIAVSANNINAGMVTGSGIYNVGDSVTVTATPLSGFKFANWTEYDIPGTTAPGFVVTTEASYTFIVGTTSASLVACFTQNAPIYYTVTFDKNGGDTEASPTTKAVISGRYVFVLPAAPTRAGYTFNGWNTAADGSGMVFTTSTAVTSDLTVYAQWSAISSGGDSGNSGNSGTVTQPVTSPVTATDGKIVTKATMDNNGKAAVSLTETQVNTAIKNANAVTAKVEINVDVPAEAKTVEARIPAKSLSLAVSKGIKEFTISSSVATITFDTKALDIISSGISGDVIITAAKADAAALSAEARQIVGDRPVYNFSVSGGGRNISQFNENVTVSVPYKLKAGEDPYAVVIYYIKADGKMEIVRECVYNSKTGSITFKTNHFSQYAVGYNKVSFKDVDANAWYGKAASFVAARGITIGTGNGNFSPKAKLTRGEFLVMAMKAYGLAPDENPKDNFSDAGNTWYTGYLAAAKRLGITAGTGDNMYQPQKEITRQELFTLLYNILKQQDKLPATVTEKNVANFSDADKIAPWARDAMEFFVKVGAINGSNGMIFPGDLAERAQMAQILYNLMSR